MTIISIITIYLLGSGIVSSCTNQEDVNNKPLDPPTSILSYFSFELIQFIACGCFVFFFRTIRSRRPEGSTEKSNPKEMEETHSGKV